MKKNWLDYYKKVEGRPFDPTLEIALKKINKAKKMFAYDLGCGAGVDTRYLLEKGFIVKAVDQDEASIEFIKSRVHFYKNLILQQDSFEKIQLEPCHLIFGRASFPFCDPRHFEEFWQKMYKSLLPQGVLCGTLFGVNDSWSNRENMTFISHKDWEKLLSNYEILYFDEMESNSVTALGEMKHWHVYQFILRKTK